jgi:hypothetical protein
VWQWRLYFQSSRRNEIAEVETVSGEVLIIVVAIFIVIAIITGPFVGHLLSVSMRLETWADRKLLHHRRIDRLETVLSCAEWWQDNRFQRDIGASFSEYHWQHQHPETQQQVHSKGWVPSRELL